MSEAAAAATPNAKEEGKKENQEPKPVEEKSKEKAEEPKENKEGESDKKDQEDAEPKNESKPVKTPKPEKPKVMPSAGSRKSSRSRKSVENFNYDDRAAKKEKLDQFEVKPGKGVTVAEFPGIENLLKKYTATSVELQYIYRLMFNRTGKKDERKKHIREFSGITWATEKDEILERIADMTLKWHKDMILKLMDMFGIDRSSKTGGVSKGDLQERLALWLIEPTVPKKELAVTRTKSKSKSSKRKRKSTSSSSKKKKKTKKKKEKKNKKVESSSEDSSSDDSSSEESESEEEPPKKKKKKKKEKKKKEKKAKVESQEKEKEKESEIKQSEKPKGQSEEEKSIAKSISDYIKEQDDPSSISFKVLKQHIEGKFGEGKAKEYRSLIKETAFKLLD